MGVPASRVSVPSARSAATLAPTFTNVADMMPLAMIPAVKYCRKATPVDPIVPWNTSPNTTSRMTGRENVKITDSRSRKNEVISRRPRDRLVRSSEGSAGWAGAGEGSAGEGGPGGPGARGAAGGRARGGRGQCARRRG